MRKGWRIFLTPIGLLIVGALAGFVIWGETPAQPMPEALDALQSDAQVTITTGEWLVFVPAASQPDTGFIIYPGGRVSPLAHAPTAHQIAEQGYLVVIVDMPLNPGVFNLGSAEKVMAAYPEIQHWTIGGHSLSGAMAANYAVNHPEQVINYG